MSNTKSYAFSLPAELLETMDQLYLDKVPNKEITKHSFFKNLFLKGILDIKIGVLEYEEVKDFSIKYQALLIVHTFIEANENVLKLTAKEYIFSTKNKSYIAILDTAEKLLAKKGIQAEITMAIQSTKQILIIKKKV